MRADFSILLIASATVLLSSGGVISANPKTATESTYLDFQLRDLPNYREEDIDIGLWSLVIAREYDSSVDVGYYLNRLDSMAQIIQHMIGPRNGDMIRLAMTKIYLFEQGSWNDNATFSYDFDDPLGERPGARLISTYLDTRRGNCVSMPTLILALMERVDRSVPIFGVAAPRHLFCRLHDRDDGQIWNIEATNGCNPMRDQWVIEQFDISQIALDSGTYLRELTRKEYVAELLGTLVAKHREEGYYLRALEYVKLMQSLSPQSVTAIVYEGALLGEIGHELKTRISHENRAPTSDEIAELSRLMVESEQLIERAKSLGWFPQTKESKDRYLEVIRQLKTKSSQ